MLGKTEIVLHHSLTADGATVSWDAIRGFHTRPVSDGGHGWREIGYHFGIELVGKTYEILHGREVWERAAAVREDRSNQYGIHICVVGNFDDAPPPEAQWRKVVELVATLAKIFKTPSNCIIGHNRHSPYKTCPGRRFDLDQLREDVAERLDQIEARHP